MEEGRIAVPTDGEGGLEGQRSEHFGHCASFTLVDIENGKIGSVTVVPNQGHQEGGCMVPVMKLSDHKVNAIIVAGIGQRPLIGFGQVGIDVYHDAEHADVKSAVESLLAGDTQAISINQTCGGGGTCQH